MPEARVAPMRLRAGSVASAGLACGPLWVLGSEIPLALADAPRSRMALERALQQARAELAALQSASIDPEASALLEFQIAMLEDESLLETAWQAIADGQTATTAWQRAIDVQLAEYVHAEDLYFQARSADLRDMRDRVLRCLAGRSAVGIPPGSVVLTRDLAPSVFLETDWREGGIALFEGSSRSHVAMLARSRNVPMLIGLVSAPERQDGYALLDAERGELVLDPDAADLADFGARRARSLSARRAGVAPTAAAPVHTRSGEHVKLLLNVADGRELEQIDVAHFDGVGLVRTELLLRTAAQLEDEQQQFEAYAAMVRWASGKPVTIRTLDAGADKPIPGYTIEEGNPFLGTRGVRLSLAAPGPLLVQLCAAARAAALGPVRVMVPMVTVPSELEAVRQLLDRAIEALLARSLAHARPALGMMVEVPLAALSIEDFNADFFSIGSNDLVQYLAAASRESGALAALQDPLHPAVLRLIRHVVKSATVRGIDVSLCGDMAADPRCVPALLDTGLRALSMAPAARAAVGGAVAAFSGALLSNPTD